MESRDNWCWSLALAGRFKGLTSLFHSTKWPNQMSRESRDGVYIVAHTLIVTMALQLQGGKTRAGNQVTKQVYQSFHNLEKCPWFMVYFGVPHHVTRRRCSEPPHPKHFAPLSSVEWHRHPLGEQGEVSRHHPNGLPSGRGTGSPAGSWNNCNRNWSPSIVPVNAGWTSRSG